MTDDNQDLVLIPRYINHKIVDGEIYVPSKEKDKWVYLCRYLDVVRVKTNLINGNVVIELKYLHNGKEKSMTVSRDVFVKSKILNELPAKGIDVTDDNVSMVLKYLLFRERKADHINVHDQVGWTVHENKRIFLLQDVIGSSIKSEYCGELNINPKGTYEGWKTVIEEEVIGNSALELALVLGLSSPVAALLKALLGLDVLFFHIYGNSTTGKTTALMLATSPFGYPSKSDNGLIRTWLATDNAILGFIKGMHGLPMAFDEASVRVKSDYTNMIYQIADGIEKGRMDVNGNNKQRGKWSGTFISTAENSLLNNSNHNNGLRVRVQELGNIQWTTSAKNAEHLKAGLVENYGQAGIKFIEMLQQAGEENLLELFARCKDIVRGKIQTSDSFTDRIVDKMAVVCMTAELARQALDINLDVEKIVSLLVDADAKLLEDRNLGLKAYEYLKSEIMRNLNKFIYKNEITSFNPSDASYANKELPNGEILGRLEMKGDAVIEALIPREQLQKMLVQGGFTDIDVILTEWRDKGVIDADNGKFTRKRCLYDNKMNVRVVVIKMDNSFENEAKKNEKKQADNQRKATRVMQAKEKANQYQPSNLFNEENN